MLLTRAAGGLHGANVRAQASGPGVRAVPPGGELARVRQPAGGPVCRGGTHSMRPLLVPLDVAACTA